MPMPENQDVPELWSMVDGKLHRELQFADFSEAFGFMARVAALLSLSRNRVGLPR